MTEMKTDFQFKTTLLRPFQSCGKASWAFVILPKTVSDTLPRGGRTSVFASVNGFHFTATLDPDGQKSHRLMVSKYIQDAAKITVGECVTFEIRPVDKEPEPDIPLDLQEALNATPCARKVWVTTSTITRLDWIHWITSAKQSKTRAKRISDACNMLAAGKRRVCCFDTSGFYSKALSAPIAAKGEGK